MKTRERLGLRVFSWLAHAGSIQVTLPRGETVSIGHGSPSADVEVTDFSAVTDILRSGLTGFAEAHMDGRIETSNLPALLP